MMHVIPPFTGPVPAEPSPDPLVAAEAQEFLKGRFSWPKPSDPKVVVEHRVAEGNAPDEILHLARALNCDMIVMGTHGRTGLSRFLTGSVAEEVLRRSACPVLAVKTPLPGAPLAEAEARAKPGEIIDVKPLGAALATSKTKTLAKTDGIEFMRLVILAGKEIAEHKTNRTLIVQCLEGRVAFTALGKTQTLHSGDLIFLPADEPHSVKGLEDASLLLTLVHPQS